MKPLTLSLLAVAALMAPGRVAAQAVTLDPDLPVYTKASGPTGSLNSVGSDTLNNLMTLWAEGFRGLYPGVKVQIEGKGSSTAPTALIEGTSQLGPMSRKMKDQEIDGFEKRFGYPPLEIPVAIDALAVYVHKDNPIDKLTLRQVDALFSKTRKGGLERSLDTWGDVGLTGSWATRGVSLFGRNSASGTYGYFKEYALFKGDFKDTVKEQPGSASVVQGVAEVLGGVGYSGIGYRTSEVRALALSKDDVNYYEPSSENVYGGRYPLSRFLYVYVNKAPNRPMDPTVFEFLRFVLSRSGQEIVVKDGYLPLKASMAKKSLTALGNGGSH